MKTFFSIMLVLVLGGLGSWPGLLIGLFIVGILFASAMEANDKGQRERDTVDLLRKIANK